MVPEDRRRSPRIKHPSHVKLFIESEQPVIVEAQDFSEIGLYMIYDSDISPAIDSRVKIQVQGVEDAQILEARVIRVSEGQGFAVEFLL